MKKIITGFIAVVLALTLVACGNTGSKKKIAVSLDSNDTYRILWLDTFKAVAEKEGYEIISANADRKPDKQITDIEALILQKPIAIFVHANEGADAGIESAFNAGIPVILVDFSVQTTKYTTQIIDGQLVAGHIAGEFVKSWLDADKSRVANIGYINGTYSDGAIPRRNGLYEILSIPAKAGADRATEYIGQSNPSNTAKVVQEGDAKWDGTNAQNIVTAWLLTNPEINVIAAMSDQMALGVVEALKTAGKNLNDYMVIGVDGSPEGLESIKKGELRVTVARDIDKEVKVAFDTMIKVINGEKVEKKVEPKAMKAVTKDDL